MVPSHSLFSLSHFLIKWDFSRWWKAQVYLLLPGVNAFQMLIDVPFVRSHFQRQFFLFFFFPPCFICFSLFLSLILFFSFFFTSFFLFFFLDFAVCSVTWKAKPYYTITAVTTNCCHLCCCFLGIISFFIILKERFWFWFATKYDICWDLFRGPPGRQWCL